MITIKIAKLMIALNLVYFIIYNTVFGWNMYPINEAEKACDGIFSAVMKVALIFFLYPIVDWYITCVKKFYKDKE